MAELRRAQQRRRNMKRGGIAAGVVVIALILALVTSGVFSSGHHKTKTATKGSTTTTTASGSTTTTTPKSTTTATTVPITSVSPLSLTALEKYLTPRKPPATSLACDAPDKSSDTATTTTTTPAKGKAVSIVEAPAGVGFPKLNGSSPRYTKFTAAPPFCINVKDTYTATMKTTAGTVVIRLLPKYAPQTVNNFVFLAGYHYFDGTVFHRVITGFVDQGGDPTATGSGTPGYEFDSETPKSNKAYDAGSLAMANDGSATTNGSQFFLTVGDGGQELEASYSVFGQVVSGLNIVNKINDGGSTSGTPKTYYKIESVTISAAAS
jgi:cyclophilin family peptidyl-prolyl cis-trans isomerase